jgi:hypothetical protein
MPSSTASAEKKTKRQVLEGYGGATGAEWPVGRTVNSAVSAGSRVAEPQTLNRAGQSQWLTPIIPATWQAGNGGVHSLGQLPPISTSKTGIV